MNKDSKKKKVEHQKFSDYQETSNIIDTAYENASKYIKKELESSNKSKYLLRLK